jgi:hypothetical protein
LETNSNGIKWAAHDYYITAGLQNPRAETSFSIDVNILSSSGL